MQIVKDKKQQQYDNRWRDSYKSIDMFGQSVTFTWKGENQFKTSFGATVSLVLMIVLGVYTLYKAIQVFDRTNPNVSMSTNIM